VRLNARNRHIFTTMATEQVQKMIAAEALEHRLSLELKQARDAVCTTMCAPLDKQCAAQDALCRAMLMLEKTKKERFIEQIQADVERTRQKLEFLDNHVIHNLTVYDRLMATGVAMDKLAVLNTPLV